MKIKIGTKQLRLANSYITSSISITFVLLILGFFSLFLVNTKDLSKNAKESVVLTVILKPDAEAGEIDVLQKQISTALYCKELKIVSPDEALDELKVDLGENISEVLDYNPLPTTISVNPNEQYSNTDSLQIIEAQLKTNDIVDYVSYNRSMVYQLDRNVRKITIVVLVLEILLLLMAVSLINGTVSLLIHSKRFEIKTMQLVGATKMFIMKPFLVRSLWHGLISSLVAVSALIIGIMYYQSSSEDIIKIGHLELVFGLVLIAGVALTVASTFLALQKYLLSKTEDLYFS